MHIYFFSQFCCLCSPLWFLCLCSSAAAALSVFFSVRPVCVFICRIISERRWYGTHTHTAQRKQNETKQKNNYASAAVSRDCTDAAGRIYFHCRCCRRRRLYVPMPWLFGCCCHHYALQYHHNFCFCFFVRLVLFAVGIALFFRFVSLVILAVSHHRPSSSSSFGWLWIFGKMHTIERSVSRIGCVWLRLCVRVCGNTARNRWRRRWRRAIALRYRDGELNVRVFYTTKGKATQRRIIVHTHRIQYIFGVIYSTTRIYDFAFNDFEAIAMGIERYPSCLH